MEKDEKEFGKEKGCGGCREHFQVDGTCWMKAIVECEGSLGTHKGLLGGKLKTVTGPHNGEPGAEFHRQWNLDSSR